MAPGAMALSFFTPFGPVSPGRDCAELEDGDTTAPVGESPGSP